MDEQQPDPWKRGEGEEEPEVEWSGAERCGGAAGSARRIAGSGEQAGRSAESSPGDFGRLAREMEQ